jgi:hypothetical protein
VTRRSLGCGALLAILAPAPALSAQAHHATGIEIGTVLGYGVARLTGQESGLRTLGGVYFGFLVGIPVAGPLGLEPQTILTRKGGQLGAAFPQSGFLADQVYVEAPVLLRLSARLGRLHLRGFGGPAPAIRLGCDVQELVASRTERPTCGQLAVTSSDLELGVVYGAGVDLHAGSVLLRADARLVEGRQEMGPAGSRIRNRQWVGAVGFSF